MPSHGFFRVVAAVPRIRVADCGSNADAVLSLLAQAEREAVGLVVFPELALTGYTCADLFQQTVLQKGALEALHRVTREGSYAFSGVVIIGVPLTVDDRVIGLISLSTGEPGSYSPPLIRLASALASPAPLAIQPARPYRQAQGEARSTAAAASGPTYVPSIMARSLASALNAWPPKTSRA